MSARMTMQEAVRYLQERGRGCTIYNYPNANTIFVFHRGERVGVLHSERLTGEPTVASLSVAKLAETESSR